MIDGKPSKPFSAKKKLHCADGDTTCCVKKLEKLQRKYEENPYTYSIPNRFNLYNSLTRK